MGTNLIQNFKIQTPMSQNQTSKKVVPDFDIQKELDNRTFIKPLKGKGKLISGNFLYTPIDTFKNAKYNLKALKHAACGKANDHELGKINDIGMMTGGLAIASYLWYKKPTPLTKGMEWIGLGSFFASMAIWPKLAIQLPAYLIHGVNVQKEYEDSFGRRKPFYQDPQFIPWDLYSDEKIDKIGDRLGVPKNIPNRRDFIQEKMKKIAVQNNTLWMLTAGFATPIMSALICNQAEPLLLKYQNNKKNKEADKILANLDNYSKKYQTNATEKTLKNIIEKHANKPINQNLADLIRETFTTDMDPVTAEYFKRDINKILSNNRYAISETTAQNITDNIAKQFKDRGFSEEFLKVVLPDKEALVQLFKNNNFSGNNFSQNQFQTISDAIVEEISAKVTEFNKQNPNIAEDLDDVITILLRTDKNNENSITTALKGVRASILDTPTQEKLIKIAQIFDNFRAKNSALDEYALIKVGAAPETVIANYWNNVSNDLLKTLNITPKEIEKIRFNRNLMGELLREKIETIVSDKTSYDKVMGELVEKVASLNSQIKPSDLTSHLIGDQETKSTYEKAVDTIFDEYARLMKNEGFTETSRAVVGEGWENGSYKYIQKQYAENRLLGVKSSFNRLINTLDFYRRVATDPNKMKHIDPNKTITREIKEELIELCKIILLEGHSSDHATKFWMLRNPHPSNDTSPLEVKAGKIINKYFGHAQGVTDIPTDKYFYQNAMNFMFMEDIHPDTKAILEKHISIRDEFTKYRQLLIDKLGGDRYFVKPKHLVSGKITKNQNSDIKFLLTGIAPDELFFKAGQQAYNTHKWLKMMVGFGAGLLGITVLSQFFIGRLKTPRQVKND